MASQLYAAWRFSLETERQSSRISIRPGVEARPCTLSREAKQAREIDAAFPIVYKSGPNAGHLSRCTASPVASFCASAACDRHFQSTQLNNAPQRRRSSGSPLHTLRKTKFPPSLARLARFGHDQLRAAGRAPSANASLPRQLLRASSCERRMADKNLEECLSSSR
jgi:hypothetical protein